MDKGMILKIILLFVLLTVAFNVSIVKADSISLTNYPFVLSWEKQIAFSSDVDIATDVVADSQGNIIVVGYDEKPGNYEWRIMKFHPDGTLAWDLSYDFSDYSDEAFGVAVDNYDNIIVVGADCSPGPADTQWRIMKFSPSGGLIKEYTADFSSGAYTGLDVANAVAVDSSNNIYVVGYDSLSGTYEWRIMKFDSNLNSLANYTNDWGGSTPASATDVAIDHNGDIIVVGYENYNGDYEWRIVKFHPSISYFSWGFPYNPTAYSDMAHGVTVDSNDNIIVVGYAASPASSERKWLIRKFGPDGSWDGYYEFDPSSIEDDVASDVTIDLQGDIVVVGHNGDKWGMIILDENLNQMLANYEGDFGGRSYAVSVDPQGNITVVGYDTLVSKAEWRIMKFTHYAPPPPSINLTPNSGFTFCTVTGCGFAPNSKLTVKWDNMQTSTVPFTLTTDSWGNFTAIILVATPDEPGNHTIHVFDDWGNEASATFTVIDMTGPPGPQGPPAPVEYVLALSVPSIIALCLAAYALIKKK